VVSWHFPPSSEVAGKVVWRLARRLATAGADVRVVVPPTAEFLALDERYARELPSGLRRVEVAAWPNWYAALLRLRDRLRAARRGGGTPSSPKTPAAMASGGTAPPQPSGLVRLLVALSRLPDEAGRWIIPAAAALRRTLRDEPADLVITVAPVFSAHLIALRAGLPTATTKWFAWSHDPMVGNPFISASSHPWSRRVARWEAEVAHRATRMLVTTDALQEDFQRRYPDIPPPVVLPCGYEPDEIPTLDPAPRNGPLVLAHVGTLYGHRSPLPILEAVARLRASGRLRDDALRLRFVGSQENASEESLAHAITRLHLEGMVSHSPAVPQADALRVIADSSAGLLLAERQPLQIPAKTFEYIGQGRPVFALTDGATASLVRGAGIGMATDREGLEEALLEFVAAWERDGLASYRDGLEAARHRYAASALAEGVLTLLADEDRA
jgi:hypothetical protein